MHTDIGFTKGLAVVSDTFKNVYSGSSVIPHLGRFFHIGEENFYGLHLITKPLARDTVGQPVMRPIDTIDAVHLSVRFAGTLAPPVVMLPDLAIVLYFSRVDKQESKPTCSDTYSEVK